MYLQYTDQQLRDLLIHELAHHIWFRHRSEPQRKTWVEYLDMNPSPDQEMVRRNYRHSEDFPAEDFAFTVQHARPEDLRELAFLNILSAEECAALVADIQSNPRPSPAAGSARAALHDSAFSVVTQ